jgi:uncharacterized protein (DUF433 family)
MAGRAFYFLSIRRIPGSRESMLNLQTDPVPIREEPSGALRVGETRVLLELVIRAFEDGATPETIVQRYPTLRLPDVYAVIAYHVRHPGDFDDYLRRREQEAVDVRQRIDEAQGDLSEIRRRLLTRSTPTGPDHAAAGQ